jgi:hypothetical protein
MKGERNMEKEKEKTLGQMIGIVGHKLGITNKKDEKVTITVNIDFRTSTDADIRSWLAANRVVAGQRPWRNLSKEEIKALDGQTLVAQNIGQKVKSKEEQIAMFENMFLAAGSDITRDKARRLAIAAYEHPELLTIKE